MTLLDRVSSLLASRGIEHALIGAAALAAHGVARATFDIDLLAVDPACLDDELWVGLRFDGAAVEVRHGDASDPLGGVVRIVSEDEPSIDLIVGKHPWQRQILRRAEPVRIGNTEIPVVRGADLILLKLYAGGPQDAWDVDQLLEIDPSVATEVEAALDALPRECASFWGEIRARRGS